ncbi:MAG: gamma-glutamyl-gamma-aminobutyrate hydrolase family protein [Streptosporangiales bacterium]|nr:gamma-glutamyl-gamma-aminobutyrate hydrolase family protein [Streptosporangiales bacterium]
MASNGSEATRPLVGLTTHRERARMLAWDTEFAMLQRTYVDAVFRAGGLPVLLPPVADGAAQLVDTVDALVVTGGADVEPSAYGEEQHEQTIGTRPERDAWELALVRRALDADLPLLGVCRGMQILNVALGGTLVQHLPDTVGHEGHRPVVGVFGPTHVTLKGGSTAALLGAEHDVQCHHHQAVATVASALDVVGWADDGTVEAVEVPSARFALGVQWHPEEDSSDIRLFEGLVHAIDAGRSS